MFAGVNFRESVNFRLTLSERTNNGFLDKFSNNSTFGVANSSMSADMRRGRLGGVDTFDYNPNNTLRFSLHGSLASFITTGKIVGSDAMENYSRYDDPMAQLQLSHVARDAFFFGNGQGVRGIEEMAQLFDERLDALRNATGISEERRYLEIEALKRGFVLAVEKRLHGTHGYNRHVAGNADSRFSSAESLGRFSLNTLKQILETGASDEVRNLLFQGLEKVILNTSRVVNGQELLAKIRYTREQEEVNALQEKFEFQQARFDELLV